MGTVTAKFGSVRPRAPPGARPVGGHPPGIPSDGHPCGIFLIAGAAGLPDLDARRGE